MKIAQSERVYIEVGKIVGVWGVKGWVKLHSYTRNREDIAGYKAWCISKPDRGAKVDLTDKASVTQLSVLNCRSQGANIVAQIENLEDREAALELSGYHILVKQDDLPALAEQEFYWHELIGLKVINQFDGQAFELGQVSSIMETGANDVLIIKGLVDEAVVATQLSQTAMPQKAGVGGKKESGQDGASEVLIPYVDSVVEQVDLAQQTIYVNWDLSYLDD